MPPPKRRYTRLTKVADQLGVSHDMLRGLVISGHVDGFKTIGRSGQNAWFVYDDAALRLASETLSSEEFEALLDRRTRGQFKMPLDEFRAAWFAGEFDDRPGAASIGIFLRRD